MLFTRRGCAQCHSIDGAAGTGPTLKDIFGETHQMTDGTSATVDENYLRESILEPQKRIRTGFQPVMSTYQGLLSNDDVGAIIEFIKTLK